MSRFNAWGHTIRLLGLALQFIGTASSRADYLSVYGGPSYTPSQPGARYDSLFFGTISLSSSGTVVSAYQVFGTGGTSLGWTPMRWSSTSAPQALGGLYTAADLPLGANFTFAVDDAGNVYGASTPTIDNNRSLKDQQYQPVRWEAASTTPIALGNLGIDPSGSLIGAAGAVNSTGISVGAITKAGFTGTVPVRWDTSGNPTELGELAITGTGSTNYNPSKINDAGVIVGNMSAVGPLGQAESTHAVRWDANSTSAVDLGANLTPRLLNQSGMIAGVTIFTGGSTPAVRWDPGATQATILLDIDLQTTGSSVRGINDSGVIVGSSKGHAVRWNPDTTSPTELGILAGATSAGAIAITDGGLIAGTSTVGGKTHAVYWGTDNVVVDLNSLIDPNSGWILNTPVAINDSDWITGLGTFDPDGAGGQAAYQRVFLILLPEPSVSAGVLLVCMIPMLRRRR